MVVSSFTSECFWVMRDWTRSDAKRWAHVRLSTLCHRRFEIRQDLKESVLWNNGFDDDPISPNSFWMDCFQDRKATISNPNAFDVDFPILWSTSNWNLPIAYFISSFLLRRDNTAEDFRHIMPSSTPLNSQEGGYGSIHSNSSDDSEVSPLIGNGAADDKKGSDATLEYVICFKRTRNLLLGALLGIIVLLVGGGTVIPRKRIRTGIRVPNDETSNPHDLPSVSLLRDESFRVSPIKHMGMLSLEREGDALPSSVWGSHLDGQPLPTNSWYLVCAS